MLLAIDFAGDCAGIGDRAEPEDSWKSIYRMLYYLPVVLPIAATSLIWMWIFNPNFGILNYGLGLLGLPADINWRDRHAVKPALMVMSIWGALATRC